MNNSLYPLKRYCQKDDHQHQQIIMICLDKRCRKNLLCCCTCIDNQHSKHQVISLIKFETIILEKLQKNNKNLQKGKIWKLFDEYAQTFLDVTFPQLKSLKSLQNSFLCKIHSLQQDITKIFQQVCRTFSQPSHVQIIDSLIHFEQLYNWQNTLEDIQLNQKYKIGNFKDTALILGHQYQIFLNSVMEVKTQINTKLNLIKKQVKQLNFCSLRHQGAPSFHNVYKYTDMSRLDNASIIEKKKNNGNRTIALGNRPLDPINNKVGFRVIKNGEGIPSICIGAAILSVVKGNNFTNCTGYKRGIYGIDQSMTTNWGSVQQSNEATAWSNDVQYNNNTIGFQFNEGDTIQMTIDFSNNTIIFQVNEEIYDMEIDCTHRDLYPFVCLSNSDSVVQIME